MGVETCFTDQPDGIYLIINSDDFGLCHAINQGIMDGYRARTITCSSLMLPAPWAPEAIQFLQENPHYPVGVHITLINSFDRIRVGPLLPYDQVSSLVNDHGNFFETLGEFGAKAAPKHIRLEVHAQIQRALDLNLTISHLDDHMTSLSASETPAEFRSILYEAAEHFKIPVLNYQPNNLNHRLELFPEFQVSTAIPADEKLSRVCADLKALPPGLHYYANHLANPAEELVEICTEDTPWAEEFRISDVAVWSDPALLKTIADCNIILSDLHEVTQAVLFSELKPLKRGRSTSDQDAERFPDPKKSHRAGIVRRLLGLR